MLLQLCFCLHFLVGHFKEAPVWQQISCLIKRSSCYENKISGYEQNLAEISASDSDAEVMLFMHILIN
jgi:hypothetical protein